MERIGLVAWFAIGTVASGAQAQSPTHRVSSASTPMATQIGSPRAATPVGNAVTSGREALMLRRLWGIEDIHVRSTASGALVRFSYRVVNAGRAKTLNDKKMHPYLIVRKTGEKLEVPVTEKIGQLRQTAEPEAGREYWIVFTNAGRQVVPGDHVDIVIGTFRASELVVESAGLAPRNQSAS